MDEYRALLCSTRFQSRASFHSRLLLAVLRNFIELESEREVNVSSRTDVTIIDSDIDTGYIKAARSWKRARG
jgi:hypothetical protein